MGPRCRRIGKPAPGSRRRGEDRGCWILSAQSEVDFENRGQATIFLRAILATVLCAKPVAALISRIVRPAARRAMIFSTLSGSAETVSGWPT